MKIRSVNGNWRRVGSAKSGKQFQDYKTLLTIFDALPAKRLPGLELLAVGGPNVPMIAASYVASGGYHRRGVAAS